MIKHPTREGTRRFWGRVLIKYPERLDADFLDVEVAMTRRNAPSIISLLDRFLDVGGVRPDLVMGHRWEMVQVPTTFLIGEYDQAGRVEEMEALVTRNPLFNVVRIPDVGHVPWVDNPESIVRPLASPASGGRA
jgi:pimeloyl-ACP methyl ester carboxylesterase